ncbi:MAG TPA: DUF4382 domain-containing protein [Balneolales bacterium]|nr:DUF4382 domain-containing protein [Balneolales bacterium]
MKRSRRKPLFKSIFTIILALSFGSLFFLQACSNGNLSGVNPSNGQGKLNVHMTDSPAANIQALTVNIVKIEAHKNGADSTSGWQVISDSSETVNILNLTNGKTRLIGSQNLDAGTYSQIRLILGSNNTVTVSGQKFPITIPSGSQTGIKINANMTVKAGESFNLLLDFNAAQSVHMTGFGNGRFMLKPVIHAVNMQLDGSIKGTIQPASAKASLFAITGNDSTSTFADTTSGHFKLVGLAPGTYSLYISPRDTSYSDSTVANIQVNSADTTNIGTITLKKK